MSKYNGRYNGWSNRPTWVVVTYINEGMSDDIHEEVVKHIEAGEEWTVSDTCRMAEKVRDIFFEHIGWEDMNWFQRDMCQINDVDWFEVAQAYVDDATQAVTSTNRMTEKA